MTFFISATVKFLLFHAQWSTLILAFVTFLVLCFYLRPEKKTGQAPGPRPWPILGSLHLMAGYKVPYAAFTALKQKYGDIFGIQLGSSACIVVNDPDSVKEVLITKGSHFDGRPDFKRFDLLFGGDKQNSLAFCNYTTLQKKRRQILKLYTFPHTHSANWNSLDEVCRLETSKLLDHIKNRKLNGNDEDLVDMKPLVLMACGNIFNTYFCGISRFDYDVDTFWRYCKNFDKVFWEVNNGRAVDFLPWLMPIMAHSPALQSMRDSSKVVRDFVEEKIIEPKRRIRQDSFSNDSKDFLDNLMNYIDSQKTSQKDDNYDMVDMDRQSALYALEDILGGHCAVANITLRILNDLASQEKGLKTQENIQAEIDQHVGCQGAATTLSHKKDLKWVSAAIHETIRLTCSPIVPHVATQNSTIGGYNVEEGTVVFINNHNLNMSPKLWDEPEVYEPSRFLDPRTGQFSKPEYFQPYSMGRRSCMGYKMVQNIAYSLVASLLQHFTVSNDVNENGELPLGMLALPPKSFNLKLKRRKFSISLDSESQDF